MSMMDLRNRFANSSLKFTLLGHGKKVQSLHWSCDGSLLASGSADETVRVWKLGEGYGKEVGMFKGHKDMVEVVRWDPKHSEILASAGADKRVRIWDVRKRKSTQGISTAGENLCMTWSSSGRYIVTGDRSDRITVIDTRQWKVIDTKIFDHEVNALAFAPEGDQLFLAGQYDSVCNGAKGGIDIFNFKSGKLSKARPCINAHSAICYCFAIDRSGKRFATGGADANVGLWDLNSLTCMNTVARFDHPVRAIAFSHDSKLIAIGSEDKKIDISNSDTGEEILSVPTKNSGINDLAWHPRKYLLAYAGDDKDGNRDDGSFRVWGLSASS